MFQRAPSNYALLTTISGASMIQISTVQIDEEIEQGVLEVLRSGIIAQGPKVAELEAMFAQISGVRNAVAVNNGTTALVAALRMLQLPPDSVVITSPFTFVATINAAVEAGLRVRFADIDAGTFNVTAQSISQVESQDVSAVMPVHLYGQCANMTQITSLANAHGWSIIEDAAQAHGAKHNGLAAGSFGVGCFSFYATKNITTGEGGIVATNDDDLADRLKVYRNQGMRQRYQYEMAGTNYRMTDIQAAIGIPQLRRIDQINSSRQRNAAKLQEFLSDIEEITLPVTESMNTHVWHQFTIRIMPTAKRTRDEVVEYLTKNGVGCGIYYPRLAHDYECFRNNPNIEWSDTPTAQQIVNQVVSLPVHQFLDASDLQVIAQTVRAAVQDS